MNPNIVEVRIESLGGLGDGIGTVCRKPIFVSKSVIGDHLRVRIVSETKESVRGEIVEILEAGMQRVDAPCLHFADCGGCSLQQLEEKSYREFKSKIVQNALRNSDFYEHKVETIFLPQASRRRAEFKLLNGKLSYLGNRSHNKVAIENCIILAEELQKIILPLQQLLEKIEFIEIVENLSLTLADNGIDLVFSLKEKTKLSDKAKDTLTKILDELGILRVSIVAHDSKVILSAEKSQPILNLGRFAVPLPQDAFLQATKEGQKLLTEFVVKATKGNNKILDLFCGIGTYSLPLVENASVHAVDDHQAMIENLMTVARQNRLKLTTEKRNLFTKPFVADELNKFDAVVINPPRAGAMAQCNEIAKSKVKNIVMVSCNPATFARDAKILKNSGFMLKEIQAIDQFVWSPHLEIVVQLQRISTTF